VLNKQLKAHDSNKQCDERRSSLFLHTWQNQVYSSSHPTWMHVWILKTFQSCTTTSIPHILYFLSQHGNCSKEGNEVNSNTLSATEDVIYKIIVEIWEYVVLNTLWGYIWTVYCRTKWIICCKLRHFQQVRWENRITNLSCQSPPFLLS
jgi:hypothetical protein